jgi:hypothetical protein
LRKNTEDFDEIKPRDLVDLTLAVSNLTISSKDEKIRVFCDKQLKVLAKRCALKMGKMNKKSQEVVREAFD